jgi:F0F1-type ATP synthase assembly protein I
LICGRGRVSGSLAIDVDAKNMWRQVGTTGFVGFQILLALWLGRVAGGWLDARLGTTPWFQWVGTALGVGVSIQLLVLVVRRYKKTNAEQDQQDHQKNDDGSRSPKH